MEVEWVYLPNFLRGLLLLALAIGVLAARPGHRLHQAMFAFLALRGAARMLSMLTGKWIIVVETTSIYFLIGIVITGLWFCNLFWESHGASASPHRRWISWVLLATGVLLAGAYMAADRSDTTVARWRDVLVVTMNLTLATIGLVTLFIAVRTPVGVHRKSLSALGAAFLLEPAYRGVQLGESSLQALRSGSDAAFGVSAAYALVVLMVIIGAALLAANLERPVLSGMIGVAALSAGIPMIMAASPTITVRTFAWWLFSIHAFWTVCSAGLMTYALVHCRVFAIDLRLKFAFRQSTVAVVLTAVFLVLTEVIEANLPDVGGVGGNVSTAVASGVMVAIVFRPVQHLATRLADRLMPRIGHTLTYHQQRSMHMYQAALEDAIVDGRITPVEENLLLNLQRNLGVDDKTAINVERAVLAGRTMAEYRAI